METTTHRVDGHDVHEHVLEVPLAHGQPGLGTITIFAREIVRQGGADRPRLVWFQGGPGHRAQRPDSINGWLDNMFVPREGSLTTAATIRGTRPLITNAYQHDGLRVDGNRLLGRLISLLRR